MQICEFNGKKCVGCKQQLRDRNISRVKPSDLRFKKKWYAIPDSLRYTAWRKKIVLDMKHGICKGCKCKWFSTNRLDLHGLIPMTGKNGKHSGQYTRWMWKIWNKDQKLIEELKTLNKNLAEEVYQLKQDIDRLVISCNGLKKESSKYKRKTLKDFKNTEEMKQYYNEELSKIDEESADDTAKWINGVQYQLLSNQDCYDLTGFTKTEIINQARICELSPVQIFHARVRIYHYLSYSLHSVLFGVSRSWLSANWSKTIPILYAKYASPKLIRGDVEDADQFWQPEIVHNEYTPKFAYKIREIDWKNDATNIFYQDGTYQYCYTIQSNFYLRKLSNSPHKYQSLIKIHIWSTADGTPIYGVLFILLYYTILYL